MVARFSGFEVLGQGLDLWETGFEQQARFYLDTSWDESTIKSGPSEADPSDYSRSFFSVDGGRYISTTLSGYSIAGDSIRAPGVLYGWIEEPADSADSSPINWAVYYQFKGLVSVADDGSTSGSATSFIRGEETNEIPRTSWQAQDGNWAYEKIWTVHEGGASALHRFFFAGNDSISGTDLNDRLDGGPGDDTIIGGSGKDEIGDRAGRNFFQGGDGADSFFLPVYGSAGYWTASVSDKDSVWDSREVKQQFSVRKNGRRRTKTRLVTEYFVDNEFNVVEDFNILEDNFSESNEDGVYNVERFSDGFGISLWDASELNCYAFFAGVTEAQFLQYLNG